MFNADRILARVDSRLVHGQITTSWVPVKGVRLLLVLDDRAARDPFESRLLQDAGAGTKVLVTRIDEGPAMLEKEMDRIDEGSVMVIFRDIQSARRAVELGFKPARLVLGNCHFEPGKKRLTDSVYISKNDEDDLRYIQAQGLEVVCQALPADFPVEAPGESEGSGGH